MIEKSKFKKFFRMTPSKVILIGFASIILVGAFLLCLPISNVNREWLPFVDALFSATTSVCVTGLMVFDIAIELSLFGQFVVLFLIQIGGLGFVTVTAFAFMILGKKINYSARITLQESLSKEDNEGVVNMVKKVLQITFFCELLGFLALAPSMIEFTGNFWSGCFKALFLSVSAFCNAGIDPLGGATAEFSNLEFFASNPFVLIPVMLLIVAGGLGFIVYVDIFGRNRKSQKINQHTRVVLIMTMSLIFIGAIIIMICEWNNPATLGRFGTFDKIVNSFFQSITTRTAGFATFSQGEMSQVSIMLSEILMFVGGSPVSIAGGIKTTTFFLLLLLLVRNPDQNGNIIYRGKKITNKLLTKAVRIAVMAVCFIIIGSALIYVFEGSSVAIGAIIYEVISALCTVGLSFGITPTLCSASKLTLIALMYVGRIGMLTIPLAFRTKDSSSSIEYMESKITVG